MMKEKNKSIPLINSTYLLYLMSGKNNYDNVEIDKELSISRENEELSEAVFFGKYFDITKKKSAPKNSNNKKK